MKMSRMSLRPKIAIEENLYSSKITNVQSFLNWLAHVKTTIEHNNTQKGKLYFRGQANAQWKLIPGIFREANRNVDEYDILHEAQKQLCSELFPMKTYLEQIVFLQHYGLPTRLLDITFNPLVALYMACDTRVKASGKVFYGCKETREYSLITDQTIKCLYYSPFFDKV